MHEVDEWWLHITDYGPEFGDVPSREAFSAGNAERFTSLGDAIKGTADIPAGKHAWIGNVDGTFFSPDQIRPLRKLLYRP